MKYTWICKNDECSHTFDYSVSMRSLETPVCPICGGETRKVITAPPAIKFKGEGWGKDKNKPHQVDNIF